MCTTIEPSAPGSLWSRCALGWAELQEPRMQHLYEIVLKALGQSTSYRLLDTGCASGIFCRQASLGGIIPVGLDSSLEFIELAKVRMPGAQFMQGHMEELPFENESFEIVTCLHSIYYSSQPLSALQEAYRVLKPRGRLVLSTWARNHDCDAAGVLSSFHALSKPHARHWYNPFSFSVNGIFQALATKAGFICSLRAEALVPWHYPDEATALRALLACDQAQRAIDNSGVFCVREALRAAIMPFRLPQGGFRLQNKFKYLVATKL